MGTKCKGKRVKTSGKRWGLQPCGRKATLIMETRVGLSRTYQVCDDAECWDYIRAGYPAVMLRRLS
jgi:hypothetical protein